MKEAAESEHGIRTTPDAQKGTAQAAADYHTPPVLLDNAPD